MAVENVMTVVVEAKSAFGIKNKLDQKWYNPSDKKLLGKFKVGNAYDVSLVQNVSKGKTYTNIAAIVKETVVKQEKPQTEVVGDVPTVPKNFKPRDFDAEARGKSMHGLICAAIQSPRAVTFASTEALLKFVDEVTTYGMNKLFGK